MPPSGVTAASRQALAGSMQIFAGGLAGFAGTVARAAGRRPHTYGRASRPEKTCRSRCRINHGFTKQGPLRSHERTPRQMSSIHPSAALVKQKYALISGLRAQGMAIAEQGAVAQAGDLFLVTDGDVVEHPARTIVVGPR